MKSKDSPNDGSSPFPDRRFRKRERISLRGDFERAFAKRCSAWDDALTVYVAANGLPWTRLGIVAGKRVGNAVCRNYAKRKIREAFRHLKPELPLGFDVICIARAGLADKSVDAKRILVRLMPKALRKLRLATENKPQSDRNRDP